MACPSSQWFQMKPTNLAAHVTHHVSRMNKHKKHQAASHNEQMETHRRRESLLDSVERAADAETARIVVEKKRRL